MSHAYETAAIRILDWLHHAERELVGKSIVTFNGEAGVIQALQLDEHHGLCFTIEDPISSFDIVESGITRRWYPVATIRNIGGS